MHTLSVINGVSFSLGLCRLWTSALVCDASGSTGVEFRQPQANPPQSFAFQNNANDYAASVAETGDILLCE